MTPDNDGGDASDAGHRDDAGHGDHTGTGDNGDNGRNDATGTVRLPPLPPQDWPPEMRDAIAALTPPEPRHPLPQRRPGRPKGLNVLGMLARHPALTRAYHAFNGQVQFATTLSVRQRELLVLRTAAVRRADYEWAQHVVLGRDAGLDDDDIARIAKGPDAASWAGGDPLERAMVAAVDELIADATITDGTWDLLRRHLDDRQLMDLVFTVGAYEVLAMALRTFGTPLDDDLEIFDTGGSERK
jgi:alkylhydroperoxidase family enzyme